MSYADPTARMIEFWTGDELEEFAAKAQIVAFPTGFDMTEEDNATRLRNATLKIYAILDQHPFGESGRIRTDVPNVELVDWLTVSRTLDRS